MIVKEKFELISSRSSGQLDNIMDISPNDLSKFEISKDDLFQFQNLALTFIRSKNIGSYVKDRMQFVKVVNMPDYPLSVFLTSNFSPVINISIMKSEYISDFIMSDIYALYLYAIALSQFSKAKIFEESISEPVINMYIIIFMKMFGKKHGLVGSRSHLIDSLKFFVALYVYVGLMGYPFDSKTIHKVDAKFFTNVGENLKIDESIKTITGLFKHLRINNIMPISENSFSTAIINRSGIETLPIFEDISRFFAYTLASFTPGSSVFLNFLKKTNQKYAEKLHDIAMKNLQRIK